MLCLSHVMIACCTVFAAPDETDAEFVPLFDGERFEGREGKLDRESVHDGAIGEN